MLSAIRRDPREALTFFPEPSGKSSPQTSEGVKKAALTLSSDLARAASVPAIRVSERLEPIPRGNSDSFVLSQTRRVGLQTFPLKKKVSFSNSVAFREFRSTQSYQSFEMEKAYSNAIKEIKKGHEDLFIVNTLEDLLKLEFDKTCSVAKIGKDLGVIARYFSSEETREFVSRLSIDLMISVITYDEMKESLSGALVNFKATGNPQQDCCLPLGSLLRVLNL